MHQRIDVFKIGFRTIPWIRHIFAIGAEHDYFFQRGFGRAFGQNAGVAVVHGLDMVKIRKIRRAPLLCPLAGKIDAFLQRLFHRAMVGRLAFVVVLGAGAFDMECAGESGSGRQMPEDPLGRRGAADIAGANEKDS